MTSLADLRTEFSQDFLRDPNNRYFKLASVDRAINHGYKRIQEDTLFKVAEAEKETTITTTGGTQTASLPSDFVTVGQISLDGHPLRKIDKEEAVRLNGTDDPTGKPYAYYIFGGSIGFTPIPDQAYTLDLVYNAYLPTISSGQDSLLPDRFDGPMLAYGAYRLFASVGKSDFANNWKAIYEDELDSLRGWIFDSEDIVVTTS